uniref:Ovule protein n=1 Tax=Parascaris univalens TaxID=6257 RepID=A0A915A425_PARUN
MCGSINIFSKPFILYIFKWKSSLGIIGTNREKKVCMKICTHIYVPISHQGDDQSKWSSSIDVHSAHYNQFGAVTFDVANHSLGYYNLPSYFLHSMNIDLRKPRGHYHQMH